MHLLPTQLLQCAPDENKVGKWAGNNLLVLVPFSVYARSDFATSIELGVSADMLIRLPEQRSHDDAQRDDAQRDDAQHDDSSPVIDLQVCTADSNTTLESTDP